MKSGNDCIAAVGPADRVKAFRAMGARVHVTTDINEARNAIKNFAAQGCPLILVPDDLLEKMPDILAAYSTDVVPAITALPNTRGETPFFDRTINEIVKKSIGIPIMG